MTKALREFCNIPLDDKDKITGMFKNNLFELQLAPYLYRKFKTKICFSIFRDQLFFLLVGGRYSVEKCQGAHILQPFHFFPMSWMEASDLVIGKHTKSDWKKILEKSFSIDFFRTSSNNTLSIMKPKYYGSKLPAYAYLGPKHCPLSFNSEMLF